MLRFKFRLKTVLYVKELKKKQAVVDYAELSRYLENQEQVLLDMRKRSEKAANIMIEESSEGITVEDLKTHVAYLRKIDKDIKSQSRVVNEIHKEKQNLQVSLFKLHNEVGVLENLRQRKHFDFLYDIAKQEEKKVDEFVTYELNTIPRQSRKNSESGASCKS